MFRTHNAKGEFECGDNTNASLLAYSQQIATL